MSPLDAPNVPLQLLCYDSTLQVFILGMRRDIDKAKAIIRGNIERWEEATWERRYNAPHLKCLFSYQQHWGHAGRPIPLWFPFNVWRWVQLKCYLQDQSTLNKYCPYTIHMPSQFLCMITSEHPEIETFVWQLYGGYSAMSTPVLLPNIVEVVSCALKVLRAWGCFS